MKMKRFPYLIVALLVGAVAYIGYQDSLLMFGTSAPVTRTELGAVPVVLSVVLFVAFCTALLINFKSKKLKIVLMSVTLILWLLVGRVVGYNVWNNSIVGGWQNIIRTREICIGGSDQSKIGSEIQATRITKLPLWRLRIENPKVNTTLYVGPFIWEEAERVFRDRGFDFVE